jgi:hypothetical protein
VDLLLLGRDESSDRFTTDSATDIPVVLKIEDDNRQIIFAADTKGSGIGNGE